MRDALVTSLSGMRSTQTLLDVTSNNIANANTPGFRGSRVTFADQFLTTWTAALPAGGALGGANPQQVGRGAQVHAIDADVGQGPITATGRDLDLAIAGDAFFALRAADGRTMYTRVGAFSFDGDIAVTGGRSTPTLVMPGNGMRVLDRAGGAVELVQSMDPRASTAVTLAGNLPRPQGTPLHGGTLNGLLPARLPDGTLAEAGTRIADTTARTGAPLPVPLAVQMAGTLPDGAAFNGTLVLSPATTFADLADQMNAIFAGLGNPPQARAVAGSGGLRVEAQTTGTRMSIFLGEQPLPAARDDATLDAWQQGAAGDAYDWSRLRLVPDSVGGGFAVHAADGSRREVRVAAYAASAAADGAITWNIIAEAPAGGAGSLVAGQDRVSGIVIAPDGSLRTPATGTLGIAWSDGLGTQVLASIGDLAGHAGGGRTLGGEDDGYPAGTVERISVDPDGTVRGWYSNGQDLAMGSGAGAIALVRFSNPAGLAQAGENLWIETANSGIPQGVADGSSRISGGALESANVDLSEEFARLIVAQRGFQTNARAFQVADGMLQDANGLVR